MRRSKATQPSIFRAIIHAPFQEHHEGMKIASLTVTLSAAKGLAVGSETSTVGVNAAPRPRCFAPLSMTDEALQGYPTLYFHSNDSEAAQDDKQRRAQNDGRWF